MPVNVPLDPAIAGSLDALTKVRTGMDLPEYLAWLGLRTASRILLSRRFHVRMEGVGIYRPEARS